MINPPPTRALPASRYSYLLGALLVLVVAPLLLGEGPFRRILYAGALVALLFAVVRRLPASKGFFRRTVVALGIMALVFHVAALISTWRGISLLSPLLFALFLGWVGILILIDLFREEKISVEQVRGAICVYLLMGGVGAGLYGFLDVLEPDSFSFANPLQSFFSQSRPDQGTFLYLSFVTLTSLGYGDITPLSRAARTLCWLQAAFGQIFLAVLVARLVGLQVAHASEKSPPSG